MAVVVIVNNRDLDTFEHAAGDGWHVDGEGQLHVRDRAGKHIAVYSNGGWTSASTK